MPPIKPQLDYLDYMQDYSGIQDKIYNRAHTKTVWHQNIINANVKAQMWLGYN